MESFSDRLKSLGFKVVSELPEKKKVERPPFEDAIRGKRFTNSLGTYYIRENNYSYEYQHGDVKLGGLSTFDNIKAAARIIDGVSGLFDLVFLDTETTGLSGGTGTFAFLVGVGRFDRDGFSLQQYIISDPQEEPAMLLDLSNYVKDTDIFVTFNGKSFDLPLLKNRFILNRLPLSWAGNHHLDMLHISRKLWRKTLDSCALQDLEREILHLARSTDEVPGWMIPEIYFDYLRSGDATMLNNVIYHNAQDIVSLAALFLHVSNILEKNVDIVGLSAGELIALAKVFSDIHSEEVAENLYKKVLELPISAEQKRVVSHQLGLSYKNKKDYSEATHHWQNAAALGDLEACVELSMHYEHRERDYRTSLMWVKKAMEILDAGKLSIHSVQRREMNKRLNRLSEKEKNHVQTKNP